MPAIILESFARQCPFPRSAKNKMPALSRSSRVHQWTAAIGAAGIAVGGALSMTVVLGAVAMLAAAIRGLPGGQLPLLLTTDPSFPWFCAAAGVFTALLAGYITSQAGGGTVRHAMV